MTVEFEHSCLVLQIILPVMGTLARRKKERERKKEQTTELTTLRTLTALAQHQDLLFSLTTGSKWHCLSTDNLKLEWALCGLCVRTEGEQAGWEQWTSAHYALTSSLLSRLGHSRQSLAKNKKADTCGWKVQAVADCGLRHCSAYSASARYATPKHLPPQSRVIKWSNGRDRECEWAKTGLADQGLDQCHINDSAQLIHSKKQFNAVITQTLAKYETVYLALFK